MDKTAIKIITYFSGIEEFLIGLLLFTIPFGWTLSIVPLILFMTTLLVNIITKPNRPSKEKLFYFLPLLAIFVWETITLLYSSDVKNGIATLTTQLALIVSVTVFLFNNISPRTIKKGFYLFLLGCITSTAIMFGIAIFNSSSIVCDAFIFKPFFETSAHTLLDTDTNGYYFLGSKFSFFVHPAYAALMLGMAIFIILINLKSDSNTFASNNFWIVCLCLLGITIILFSLNGTLILSAAIVLSMLGILSTQKVLYIEKSRVLYTILLVFVALIIANPQTRLLAEVKTPESITKRIHITQSSLEIIKNHWLGGVGIGDDKTELIDTYNKLGHQELAARKFNSHNQFLTTWIQSGIIGILLLIWSLVTIVIRSHKKKEILLLVFAILTGVSFMFESMLLRYWGVITFTLFYGMLYFYSEKELVDKFE